MRLKILTVAGWMHPDAEGGSFRFVYELNRALALRGHSVAVLTQRLRPELPAEEELNGIRVLRHDVKGERTLPFYWGTITAVRRKLREIGGEFDLIHVHHPASAFAASLFAPPGKPLVQTLCIAYFLEYLDRVQGYTLRGGLTGGQKLAATLLRRMEYHTLSRCSRVVVFSEDVRKQVEMYYPRAVHKLSKVPGGIDLEFFSNALPKAQAREQLGLPPDAPVLLTVRRLEPRMGINSLVDAMPAIRREFPDCLLLIGGRGALKDEIDRQVAESGLSDCVRLCGYIDEQHLPVYYRAADAFVLPTRALEGFGLVTLEAFACGTPAIVTPAGASPEVAGPVDRGLVTAGTGPREIADAVVKLLRRPDRDTLSERCRRYAEQFSWDAIAEQYEKVYEEAIAAAAIAG